MAAAWIMADPAKLRAAGRYAAQIGQRSPLPAFEFLTSGQAADLEAALTSMLGTETLGKLLDVGTGTGRMAQLYAPAADHVVAIDKSPDMLRIARARLQHLPPGKVELVQGDFTALPFADAVFDTVLFHQVLHYSHTPETVLTEAARVTAPGGRIALVDFAAHDREELRHGHAHARLGFTDAQIAAMLDAAGFALEADRALAGHELIVKLWTARRRAPANVSPLVPSLATGRTSRQQKA